MTQAETLYPDLVIAHDIRYGTAQIMTEDGVIHCLAVAITGPRADDTPEPVQLSIAVNSDFIPDTARALGNQIRRRFPNAWHELHPHGDYTAMATKLAAIEKAINTHQPTTSCHDLIPIIRAILNPDTP